MPKTIDDMALDAVRAIWPPDKLRLLRTARLALTDDGKARADRLHGTIPAEALPAIDSDQVADEPGSGVATVKDRLNTLAGGSAPLASPTFTGTVTAVDLVVTGNSTLGNGDTDAEVLQGHLRHKGAAPSIVAGVALGSGGSVGAAVLGTDQAMNVTLTAGTTGLTSGVAATITFATARPNLQHASSLMPMNSASRQGLVLAGLSGYAAATTTIVFGVAPTSGTVYQYDLILVEWTH